VKLYESKWRWLVIPLGFVTIACAVNWLAAGSTGLGDAVSGVIAGLVVVAIIDFKRRRQLLREQ
jgi:1,4-dihydroxy-2-naphthoate octaprenyltransferase